ncbi:N-acetylglucosamine-6-phosphate deacetylase [Palleronia sp. LCG004]|uniref:N-acetylglucosamine-6-phosphate deacetylase n=1 Tax=Palleronia sp. LCG004 TaxID=3079304 RepID=UPI002941D2CE|nr:N-acetylglucosamine-6-phosphate deacetylase [Palleronia sp. LCG004]WOI55863.1 N-acetylglucosamine-6-phosphate deacetylase [Palleronia sp. LCG004]
MIRLIHARTLYDGTGGPPRHDCVVEIAEGRIGEVSTGPAPAEAKKVEIAAPGFIDLQINGAADVQFNEDPTPDAIARIAEGARRGGAAHILPTFITAPGDGWQQAIAAVRAARSQNLAGLLGLHLEGPFLSPQRPGIHPAAGIRPMREEDLALLERVEFPLMLTIAPEEQPKGTIERLSAAGIVVFAGHSIATASDLDAAASEGLSGLTHLWNAMPPPQGRAPGMVVRALTHPTLFAGIIADGHHVDPLNLTLASAMMKGRLFLVTDAMRSFAGSIEEFDLMGTPVTLRDGRLTGPDGTLAGAHLGMDEAVRMMIDRAGVPPEAAIAMATDVPARVMGLGSELGRIATGFRASLSFLDEGWNARGGLVDGVPFD